MDKPAYLNADYASVFKAHSVAELYPYRPPYSAEVIDTLLRLIPESPRTVLDIGCGPGKIARELVDNVERVDAVDFSAEMLHVGKSLPYGNHPRLHWQCAAVEEAELTPPYGLIVAGACLHYMDWQVVFARFANVLAPDGILALVNGDLPSGVPWLAARKALISEYSTNQGFRPFDTLKEVVQQGYLKQLGQLQTAPVTVKPTLEAFLKSEHSRSKLTPDAMGPAQMAAFDAKMQALLQPYTVDGHLPYEVTTQVIWGKPLKQ